MIIIITLLFFVAISNYVISAFQEASSTRQIVEKVYLKEQGLYIAQSAIPLIKEILKRDDQTYDSFSDNWTMPIELATEEGSVSVTIYDEDRFFNLNYVKSEKHRQVLERLFLLLNIDPYYIDSMLVWIGERSGGIDTDYPVKGKPFDTPLELKYIGMSEEDLYGKMIGNEFYEGLLVYVTAHSSGKININTAPKKLLMALDPSIDETIANKIIERRKTKPFKKLSDLGLIEGLNPLVVYNIEKFADVKSQFFRIEVRVKVGDAEVIVRVIYDRKKDKIVYREII